MNDSFTGPPAPPPKQVAPMAGEDPPPSKEEKAGNKEEGKGEGKKAGKGRKKRKGGRGRKPRPIRLKLTDSKWEQSFLISYLPEFVKARTTYYTGDVDRLGEFVGIYGNQADMLGLMVDANIVESFSNLTSAQASALIPKITLQKVATPEVLKLFPEAPKMIPIKFADHVDVRAIMDKKHHMINGAGIKDITIIRKLAKRGPSAGARAEVDITFQFDSMETFVHNQRHGISFLDLIPTAHASAKTAGRKDVLYHLRLTFGYQTPLDASGMVFTGLQGRRAMAAVDDMNRSFQLMYGGKHDIQVLDNGGVELKLKYLTTSEVLEGSEAQQRSDILGKGVGLPSKEQQEERQNKEEELRKAEQEATDLHKKGEKIEADYQKTIQTEMEEYQRRMKGFEMAAFLGDVEDKQTALSKKDWSGAANYGKQYIADKDLIDAKYRNQQDVDEEAPDFEEFQKVKQQLQDKLKSAAASRNAALEKQRQSVSLQERVVHKLHQDLANLTSGANHVNVLEGRYASLVAELHSTERLYCLDLTPKEISDYSAKRQSDQFKKYKEFKGKLSERLDGKPPEHNFKISDDKKTNDILKYVHDMLARLIGTDTSQEASAKAKDPLNGGHMRDKRIYYFYFGDLVDIAMRNFYGNAESATGGSDKSVKNDRINTLNMMLGDFYYTTSSGKDTKDRKGMEKKDEATAYNMMDFPISLTSFSRFFVDRFIRQGVEHIPVELFFSEIANYFFAQPVFTAPEKNSFGPLLNPKLHAQRWNFEFAEFASTVKLHRGFAQKILKQSLYDMNTDEMKKMFIKSGGQNEEIIYSYLTVGPGTSSDMPTVPLFTIFMGHANSFIKHVKYNAASGNKRSRTTRIHKAKKEGKGMPKFTPAASYDVAIDLMGAPFFEPNMCFELNNNVFGTNTYSTEDGYHALTKDGDDLLEILPRILRVSEVTHKISASEFITSLKCRPTGLSFKKFMDSRGDELYDIKAISQSLASAAKEEAKAKKKARKKK